LTSNGRRRARGRAVAAFVAVALAFAAVVVGHAAAASTSARVQLSVHAAPDVLSVTVSPTSGAFGGCHGGDTTSLSTLGFPNGTCRSGFLSVTNTGLPSRIMITGSSFSPLGGGTPWLLCGATDGTTPSCQNQGQPGAEQFKLQPFDIVANPGVFLSAQAQCDVLFQAGAGCIAAPGQLTRESLLLTGPQSTANGASDYSTTVTWTAVAP
jgi:hypothetical protein